MVSWNSIFDHPAVIHLKIGSQYRILLAALVVGAAAIALLGRLVYLQVVAYDNFSALSVDNRIRVVPTPPIRGQIYDRNGVILARNETAYRLDVVPANADDLDQLLADLSTLVELDAHELKTFQASVRNGNRSDPHTLKDILTDAQVGLLAVNMFRLPGAHIDTNLYRVYVQNEYASHVVGRTERVSVEDQARIDPVRYRGTQHIGKYGAERAVEDTLLGWPGYQQVETNAHGNRVRTVSSVLPKSGNDVFLTIDAGLQRRAFDALGEQAGAVVAIDPRTGDVLAMVSKPSFNPNEFGLAGDSELRSELLQNADSPLLNRAIQGRYPPGSTIKPFMGLAIHEYNLADRTVFCPGYYQLPGVKRKYRCWKSTGHGQVDLRKAIAESCDVYFYVLSQSLGIDGLNSELAKFGFGQPTGIDLVYEYAGILPSRDWKRRTFNEPWYLGETLSLSIGQGALTTTVLQLAQATSLIATQGEWISPKLIYKTVDANTGQALELEPRRRGLIDVNPAYYNRIIPAMIDVVHGAQGTARRIAPDLQYTVAAKTGTVQVISRPDAAEDWDVEKYAKKFQPHGTFIAFAPAEDPQIVVAAVVENIGAGSAVAPIVKEIMDHHLLGAAPDGAADQVALSAGQ